MRSYLFMILPASCHEVQLSDHYVIIIFIRAGLGQAEECRFILHANLRASLSRALAVPYIALEDVQPPADFAVLSLVTAYNALSLGLVDHLRGKADGHTFLLCNVHRGPGTRYE